MCVNMSPERVQARMSWGYLVRCRMRCHETLNNQQMAYRYDAHRSTAMKFDFGIMHIQASRKCEKARLRIFFHAGPSVCIQVILRVSMSRGEMPAACSATIAQRATLFGVTSSIPSRPISCLSAVRLIRAIEPFAGSCSWQRYRIERSRRLSTL